MVFDAPMLRPAVVALVATLAACAHAEPVFCGERPTEGESASLGKPAAGSIVAAKAFVDTRSAQVLPARHRRRCLAWGTPRLVDALVRAGASVQATVPNSPALGIGNIARAGGGPITFYSHSHQSGRDVDLQFYMLGPDGEPAPPEDLYPFDESLHGRAPDRTPRTLDVVRTWALVRALLDDPSIEVQWLFVSEPIKAALLAEARQQKVPEPIYSRASERLHQPSDAPAHDDHLHLRIGCSEAEIQRGCTGGK